MIKFLNLAFVFLISAGMALASGEKYYEYQENLDVKFLPQTVVPKDEKAEYKRVLKNEKYFAKHKYSKAEKLKPDFIPNVARLIPIYTAKKDFPKALEYAIKLKELDSGNYFSTFAKDYRLGVLYSQNGDYMNSNKYLSPYVSTDCWSAFQIAQNYYYMQDLKTAEIYALKVKKGTGAYYSAQELLYTIYSIRKDAPKAYKAARYLVTADAYNPQNYMRVANITTNNAEKLINFYRAKQIYIGQNLLSMVLILDEDIADLEQKKIDAAYKKITSFCKKPDWNKIKQQSEKLLSDDVLYWDKRQDNFFSTANDCISRYSGNNLAACFNELNRTEENLDKELVAEQERRIERAQREAQLRLLQEQNQLIQQQNYIQQMRRYDYYYYYRPRYYWW